MTDLSWPDEPFNPFQICSICFSFRAICCMIWCIKLFFKTRWIPLHLNRCKIANFDNNGSTHLSYRLNSLLIPLTSVVDRRTVGRNQVETVNTPDFCTDVVYPLFRKGNVFQFVVGITQMYELLYEIYVKIQWPHSWIICMSNARWHLPNTSYYYSYNQRSRSSKGRFWPQISGSSNERFWRLFKH